MIAPAVATRVGRYTLLRRLGAGGMGEVWEAHDPELERRLAIKVVRTDAHHDRMMREARALAQLAHPGVVAVTDVGVADDGRLWIAMELLEGGSARAWIATPRPWRTVVEAFLPAARGLAAAHRAGLIHRDVKPDNILLRKTGELVLGDFGLVRHGATSASPDGPTDQPDDDLATGVTVPGAAGSGPSLTRTGAAVGTPPYMAPEQHLGRGVDARADQFAFAITMWEALAGVRPFTDGGAGNAQAWSLAIINGRRAPAPADRPFPTWLRRALNRALAIDRDARFPTMDALIAALESGLRRRRRTAIGAGVTGAVAAMATVVLVARTPPARAEPCRSAAAQLDGVWDDARRADVAAAFDAIDAPFSADQRDRVLTTLDARRAAWIEAHTATCRATHVAGTQSPALLDLRMACLDDRRAELSALVDALQTLDRDALPSALSAAAALPPLAACDDDDALRAAWQPPTDPAQRRAFAALVARERAAFATGNLGKHAASLRDSGLVAEEAERLGYLALAGRARYGEGQEATRLGDAARARVAFEAAIRDAAGAAADLTAAEAWTQLLLVLLDHGELSDARALLPAATAAVTRAGEPAQATHFLIQSHGWLAFHDGDLVAARGFFERGLAHLELAAPDDLSLRGQALGNLATIEEQLGDHVAAVAHREAELTTCDALFGPGHPIYAETLAGLATSLRQAGDKTGAVTRFREAVAALERAYGPDSPVLGVALQNYANAIGDLGDRAGAIATAERAVAIFERAGSSRLDMALGTLAVLRYEADDLPGAIDAFERSLNALDRRVGKDHYEYALIEVNYAPLLDCARGAPRLDHAIAVLDPAVGADHEVVVGARAARAACKGR